MKHLIVVPAFNEEQSLPDTIDQLQKLGDEFQVLIVDDGSHDNTREIAHRVQEKSLLKVHVASLPLNCGIGVAVQTGYLFAVREELTGFVIQFDGDGQHDAEYIPLMIQECLARSLDLCIGSRFLDRESEGFRSTFLRRVGIRFLARLISGFSGARITDPTSGFRCAGEKAWRIFAEDYPDDYPEPESLAWALRHGLRVGEIPVRMHARKGGVSSIRLWHGVYYMMKVTLAILVERIRGRY